MQFMDIYVLEPHGGRVGNIDLDGFQLYWHPPRKGESLISFDIRETLIYMTMLENKSRSLARAKKV